MASDEEQEMHLLNPAPGVCNKLQGDISSNDFGRSASNTQSGLATTQENNLKSREENLLSNKPIHVALVFSVDKISSKHMPGITPTNIKSNNNDVKTYTIIHARVPQFDSALPMPEAFKKFIPNTGQTNFYKENVLLDSFLIKQHPSFIWAPNNPAVTTDSTLEEPEPGPGDYVNVYYNDARRKTGICTGIYKKGYPIGQPPSIDMNNPAKQSGNPADEFPRPLKNLLDSDEGPQIASDGGRSQNPLDPETEAIISEIMVNALPGPVINGHNTILMFNIPQNGAAQESFKTLEDFTNSSNSFNHQKHTFMFLESGEVLEAAIRFLLAAQLEGIILNFNSSFRPSYEDLKIKDLLDIKDLWIPGQTYFNWNRGIDENSGIIDAASLRAFIDGLPENMSLATSQTRLRDIYNCEEKSNQCYTVVRKDNGIDEQKPIQVARVGNSRHESGFAIDIEIGPSNPNNPSDAYKWLVNNMYKYGFYRTAKDEKWHWRFNNVDNARSSVNTFSILKRSHISWDGLGLGEATVSQNVNDLPLKGSDG